MGDHCPIWLLCSNKFRSLPCLATDGVVDCNEVLQKKEVAASLWNSLILKDGLLRQKSKIRWINEGDANSKYLHACLHSQRRKNNILMLEKEGVPLEEVDEIKLEVRKFFENSYNDMNVVRPSLGGVEFQKISEEDNLLLTAPVTEEKIKEEVWGCDGNKSSGPDGFDLWFFMGC